MVQNNLKMRLTHYFLIHGGVHHTTSDVGVHCTERGIGKGGKAKHILDRAGFVGWAHLILAWKVANMLVTCLPDSQMSALLADILLSWRHKTDPDTVFLCRGLPTFTQFVF